MKFLKQAKAKAKAKAPFVYKESPEDLEFTAGYEVRIFSQSIGFLSLTKIFWRKLLLL